MDDDTFNAGVVLLLLSWLLAGYCTWHFTTRAWEKEAVSLGHAEYDTKDASFVWQWKEIDEDEQ